MEITRLATTAGRQYGCPQEIEWAVDKHLYENDAPFADWATPKEEGVSRRWPL